MTRSKWIMWGCALAVACSDSSRQAGNPAQMAGESGSDPTLGEDPGEPTSEDLGLPAGVQLFSLFEANPQLLDLLGEICAAAPQNGWILRQECHSYGSAPVI